MAVARGVPRKWWLSLYLPNCCGIWEKRIPTQIFESLWAGVLLLLAVLMPRSAPFPGALFLLVSLGYATGRLLMEFARERPQKAYGFSIAHVISLAITLVSVSTMTVYWRR
jgi:prolipoprotein diacylglyceryltransferase